MVITSTPADAFGDTGNDSLGVKKDDPVVFVVDLVLGHQAPRRGHRQGRGAEGGPADGHHERGQAGRRSPSRRASRPRPRPSSQPLIEGTGPEVKKGQTVRVAYTGALLKDGSVFDSSANRPEQPYFDFPIGAGPGHQGLGQRPASARRSAAACSSSSRRPTATAPPAARRRSRAPTPWSSSSTSSPRTEPTAPPQYRPTSREVVA